VEAHIAGIPIEETALSLMPVGAVALGAVAALASRAAKSLRAGRRLRVRAER
jgi:hypothetical protein